LINFFTGSNSNDRQDANKSSSQEVMTDDNSNSQEVVGGSSSQEGENFAITFNYFSYIV